MDNVPRFLYNFSYYARFILYQDVDKIIMRSRELIAGSLKRERKCMIRTMLFA